MRRKSVWIAEISGAILACLCTAASASAVSKDAKIRLFEDKSGDCDHDVDQKYIRLKKDDDVLVWQIHNDCNTEQKVALCVYEPKDAFYPCGSHPMGRDLNQPFTMAKKETPKTNILCIGQKGDTKPLVVFYQGVTSCPASPPPRMETKDGVAGKVKIRTHTIEIEIVP